MATANGGLRRETVEAEEPRCAALSIDHLALRVRSFEQSIPFYDALLPLLGFEKQREHFWRNDEGFHIQIDEADEGSRAYDRFGPGVNHVGFAAPSLPRLAAVRDAMRVAGFDAPRPQLLGGASALFMKDPDGFRLEITYFPEGA